MINKRPEFMIQFGSKRVQAAISDARFATCLTEDVRQSLQVNMSFCHCDVSLYNVFIFLFIMILLFKLEFLLLHLAGYHTSRVLANPSQYCTIGNSKMQDVTGIGPFGNILFGLTVVDADDELSIHLYTPLA